MKQPPEPAQTHFPSLADLLDVPEGPLRDHLDAGIPFRLLAAPYLPPPASVQIPSTPL